MNTTNKLLSWGLVLGLATACGQQEVEAPQTTADTFEVQQNDGRAFEVFATSAGETIHLLATQETAGITDVTIEFDDMVLAYRVDENRGVGDFMPGGELLDAGHLRMVDQLIAGVETLPIEGRSKVSEMAYRVTSLTQAIPAGEFLQEFRYVAERGWTHISCSCGSQNVGGATIVAGRGCSCGQSNGCRGRCGPGCNGWGFRNYTRDCAKHDAGLGSWGAASDDWTFAPNNCSSISC